MHDLYTLSITQGYSPHERLYLASVINWINYICLKCSHSQVSFPSVISDRWCRKPTSVIWINSDVTPELSCLYFYSLSNTLTLCSHNPKSIFIECLHRFIPLGILRAANLASGVKETWTFCQSAAVDRNLLDHLYSTKLNFPYSNRGEQTLLLNYILMSFFSLSLLVCPHWISFDILSDVSHLKLC